MRTGRMLFIGSLICRCRLVLGIPTSESHGLMAGMLGSGLALGTGGAVHWQDWQPVLAGLFLSLGLGFCWDGFYTVLQDLYFTNWEKSACPYGKKAGAAACAVMHGGQDGQKFAAMLGLAWQMAANLPSLGKQPSPIAAVLCAAAMGIGTLCGGRRIIQKTAVEMVKIDKSQRGGSRSRLRCCSACPFSAGTSGKHYPHQDCLISRMFRRTLPQIRTAFGCRPDVVRLAADLSTMRTSRLAVDPSSSDSFAMKKQGSLTPDEPLPPK